MIIISQLIAKLMPRNFFLNLFDINFLKKKKICLIGIFHSLDHCDQPKKVLEKALKISDYVIIHCHDVSNL